tara:strand:+ start:12040 stop:12156 length:117 start_codon:yes stop_codon:yes gene_type:complete
VNETLGIFVWKMRKTIMIRRSSITLLEAIVLLRLDEYA